MRSSVDNTALGLAILRAVGSCPVTYLSTNIIYSLHSRAIQCGCRPGPLQSAVPPRAVRLPLAQLLSSKDLRDNIVG